MRDVKRRVFPEAFKREAVDRVVSSGLSAGAVEQLVARLTNCRPIQTQLGRDGQNSRR